MTNDLKELIERLREYSDEPYDVSTGEIAEWMHKAADTLEAKLCAVVKPLEWEDASAQNNWVNYANSPYGEYYIGIDGGSHQALIEANEKPYHRVIGKPVGKLWEAKAAAQADYESRILSTLNIPSASDVAAEARALAIEAAAEAIDDAGYYCVPPYEEIGSLPNQIDHSLEAILSLHDTDTAAAIERIKEQARQEERERTLDAVNKYMTEQYGISALGNQIDRDRIAAIREDE